MDNNTNTTRLTILISKELRQRFKGYCSLHGTTMTDVVIAYITQLMSEKSDVGKQK